MNDTTHTARLGRRLALLVAFAILGAAAIVVASAITATDACGICGKNLIKNPGADAGLGITSVDASGAVPGWTIEAGQFGAAEWRSRTAGSRRRSRAPKKGKNYFFGGTTPDGDRRACVDRQADHHAGCGRGRQESDAQRLARELRQEHCAGARRVRRRDGKSAAQDQDRSGHDDLGHRHVGAEPEREGARGHEAGDDRHNVRGRGSRTTSSRARTRCRWC